MADFDPIHAQTEVVAGLADVYRILFARAQRIEAAHIEAEAEFNALVKLVRFVEGLLDAERAKLRQLQKDKGK